MSRKRRVYLKTGPTPAKPSCPNCLRVLGGATLVHAGSDPGHGFPKLKGHHTVCAYCGAMLIFADDAGNLRMMTEAERNEAKFDPAIQFAIDHVRSRAAQQPNFSKKTYNN